MHQPCNVAKARSCSSAASRSPTSKVSQLRRKRFFVLVRILLKRLERDDPEGYERAKEVSIIWSTCVLNRAHAIQSLVLLIYHEYFLNYWSSHTQFLTALLHTCHRLFENVRKRIERESPTSCRWLIPFITRSRRTYRPLIYSRASNISTISWNRNIRSVVKSKGMLLGIFPLGNQLTRWAVAVKGKGSSNCIIYYLLASLIFAQIASIFHYIICKSLLSQSYVDKILTLDC